MTREQARHARALIDSLEMAEERAKKMAEGLVGASTDKIVQIFKEIEEGAIYDAAVVYLRKLEEDVEKKEKALKQWTVHA